MVSLLSFDSRSIASLLGSKNEKYFDEKYPIIYKNKVAKKQKAKEKKKASANMYYYISPIDSALKNNQVKAVEIMIEYMVKYQNNFVSSFIFLRNFHLLLEKEIPVRKLLDSHIFNYTFDFDEWPGNHPFAGPGDEQ